MRFTRVFGAVLALMAAACSDTSGPAASGKTKILLTDDPFPYNRISQVNVHIVRIQTAAVPDSVSANWTTVAEPNRTINLLDLQGGSTTLLGEANLDATTIGAVRVVINTSLSSVVDSAGNPVTVHWPVSGEMALNAYVQASLADFAPGTAHNLVIDFDVGRSFEDIWGDGSLVFLSWIRVIDDAGAGAVAGTVTGRLDSAGTVGPLHNTAVTVLSGDPAANPGTWFKVATARTDAQGHYRVAYLLLGNYIVRVEPLGDAFAGCLDSAGVAVSAQQTTTLNVTLPAPPGTCGRHTGGGGGVDTNGVDTTSTVDQTVAHVNVNAFPSSPVVGDSIGVRADITNAANQTLYGKATTWVVSDTTVLGITWQGGQNLLLKAKKTGSATISATSESVTGQVTLTVH